MDIEVGGTYKMRCGRVAKVVGQMVFDDGTVASYMTALSYHHADGRAVGNVTSLDLVERIECP